MDRRVGELNQDVGISDTSNGEDDHRPSRPSTRTNEDQAWRGPPCALPRFVPESASTHLRFRDYVAHGKNSRPALDSQYNVSAWSSFEASSKRVFAQD